MVAKVLLFLNSTHPHGQIALIWHRVQVVHHPVVTGHILEARLQLYPGVRSIT